MSEAEPRLLPDYGRRRSNMMLLRILDSLTYGSALGGALVMLALLLLVLTVIAYGASDSMRTFGLGFLTSSVWNPVTLKFGARTAIMGTLLTSSLALVMSFPVSLGSAIFLVKLAPKFRIPLPRFGGNSAAPWIWVAPRHLVTVASFLIELLAAIPSIAYGLWGAFVVAPFMQTQVQPFAASTLGTLPGIGVYFQNLDATGSNVFTASFILAVMVTPIMTAIMRDVLSVAPPELEQGALGLGATWWQATRLVLGFSKMGIIGAVILGFARAIGETMAVTMVIGNGTSLEESLFSPGQTIASLLANQFREADTNALRDSLIYVAFVLLVITMLINGAARLLIMRVARKAGKK